MMLEHLGEPEAASLVMKAIEKALEDPMTPRTPDMGGTAGTRELGSAITDNIVP